MCPCRYGYEGATGVRERWNAQVAAEVSVTRVDRSDWIWGIVLHECGPQHDFLLGSPSPSIAPDRLVLVGGKKDLHTKDSESVQIAALQLTRARS
jgi:hypothetical protein